MQPYAPVGIIGLGLMGTALSGRLIDAEVPSIEAIRRRPIASEGSR
jgi:3-hydroxyisobutyrate dehydrogenase-like beta-hydroxyacid dehydrogenase